MEKSKYEIAVDILEKLNIQKALLKVTEKNVTIDDFEKRLDFYLEKLDKVLDLLDKHDVKS